MCIFQSKKFELYPELTRIHEDYYLENETEQEHYTRILAQRRAQNADNRERNKSGQVPASELAERKAAERQSNYQTAPAQTKYIVYTNPEPTDEIGAEHRKYWVIDTSPRPYFIAPGVIMEGTDSLEEAKYWRDYHESCG